MNFSIKDFFSKCDQIRSKLRVWSHLLNKFLMENFIFFVHCGLILEGKFADDPFSNSDFVNAIYFLSIFLDLK